MSGSACAAAVAPGGMRRDPVTWYAYLLLGFFTFLLNIQGNIIPFLQAEMALSYRVVGLHSSAIALGMIITGLVGERIVARLGRRRAMALGGLGAATGAVLLCLAPAPWASIAACFVIGATGTLIPSVVPAMLAVIHGRHRDRALAELSATCYAFGVLAPLAMGAALGLGLGWRGAILFGVAIGIVILLGCRGAEPPALPSAATRRGRLPAAYWAYWALLAVVVAIEFVALLWAPAFLERVVGLTPPVAATTAALFALAMLIGRTGGSTLVGRFALPTLYVGALGLTLVGFALYWAADPPVIAITGLFVLGLGIALLYPLTLGLALEAAGPLGDAASARFMLAVGLAVLTSPLLLGALADRFGLHAAHLILPVLVVVALAGLAAARRLERGRGMLAD